MSTVASARWKVIGYGFLLYVAFNLSLFVASLFTGTEDANDIKVNSMMFVMNFVVTAALMFLVSWWLCRLLRPGTRADAMRIGAWWAAIVLVLLLVVTIANKTTHFLFGTFAGYLVLAAIVSGASFGVSRRRTIEPPTV